MDLLNMTNRAQIHKFYKKLNRENVDLWNWSFQILWLISSMKDMKKIQISAQYF